MGRNYIQEQRNHHAAGKTIDRLERITEVEPRDQAGVP